MESRTNEFICQICHNPFNENENVPKILPCGHTICKSCVTSLLKVSKYCPICRRSLDESEQATNYALLNLCDSFSKAPTNFKNDVAHIYIKKISKSLDNVHRDLQNAIKDTEALSSLRSQNDIFLQQMEDVRISFNEIKLSVQTLQSGLCFTQKGPEVNINIKNYASCEIAERLLKGEKMFAVANINDEMRYGKVYCRGHWIFINALTLTDIEKNSSVFWMYDFKKQFKEQICPFFTLSYLEESFTKIIKLLECANYSELLELCTGETGTILKGFPYFWKDKSLSINVHASRCVTFCFEKSALKIYERTTTNMEVLSALNWEFFTNKEPNLDSYTVGKFFRDIKFPFLFPKESCNRVIKESGIAVGVC